MRRKHPVPLSLAAVFAMVVVAACSAASAPGPAALGAAFHDKVVAACAASVAAHTVMGTFPLTDFNPTKPDPAQLPAIAGHLQRDADRYATLVADLTALGQPATGGQLWSAVLDVAKRHASIAADQAKATASGDTATFTKDFNDGTAAQAAFLAAITAAGVPECAPVDR